MPGPRSLPRSLITSVGTSALDLGLFVVSSFFVSGALLVVARWLSGAAGAFFNFAINRRWAFAHGGGARPSAQIARYAVVAVGAVTLATCVFALLKLMTPLDLRVSHLMSLASVWLLFTYPLLRGWVFACPRVGASSGGR